MTGDGESAHHTGYFSDPSAPVGVETVIDTDTPQPQHPPTSSVPAPPAWPKSLEEDNGAAPPATLRDTDASPVQPSVEPGRWVHEPDFWEKETMIAMTGRYPVPRPKTRPLPPPQRFRPMARWKSVLALIALVVVAALACVGSIELGKLSIDVFGTQATPIVTQTAHPTISPTKPAHK